MMTFCFWILLFWCVISGVNGNHHNKVNTNILRVSIRKDLLQDVPSCQHRITQVELLNTHPSDRVIIQSIRTMEERTILLNGEDTAVRQKEFVDLPQQFHVSRLSSNLDLGPGQIAIVPLTFLPRFPNTHEKASTNSDTQQEVQSSPPLKEESDDDDEFSIFQEADWLDMLDDDDPLKHRTPDSRPSRDARQQHRNNLSQSPPAPAARYQTISAILVETDHGTVETHVSATSVRANSYKLPDVIYFNLQRSTQSSESDINHDDDQDRRIQETVNLIQSVKERDRKSLSVSFTMPSTNQGNCGNDCKKNCDKLNWIVDRKMIPQRQPSSLSDAVKNEAHLLEQNASPPMRDGKRDCFDLYLKNPAVSADLRVLEISLSMTERVSLHILSSRAQSHEPLLATSAPRKVISEWRTISSSIFGDVDERALMVPADGAQHYLVTVCASRTGGNETGLQSIDQDALEFEEGEKRRHSFADLLHWVDSGRNNSLGFLQIKTSHDTLFVGLEENADFKKPVNLDDFAVGQIHNSAGSNGFRTNPEKFSFHFVSSTTPKSRASIDIINESTVPLKIMRATIGVRPIESNHTDLITQCAFATSQLESFGIQMNLAVSEEKISAPLLPGKSVNNAVEIFCSFNREEMMKKISNSTLTLRGALVLRGTTRLDWTSDTWEDAIKENPHLDASVVLEVPFVIHVSHGRVGFLAQDSSHPLPSFWLMKPYDNNLDFVAGLHFPLHSSFVTSPLSEREKQRLSPSYEKEFAHYLRVFSDLNMNRVVDEAAVVGADDNEEASLCRHFDTSIIERGPSDHIDLGHLSNLGLVLLRYRFPDSSRFKTGYSSSEPVTCFLRISTNPDTGYHEIPLVLYWGKIDATENKFSMSSSPSNKGSSSDTLGSESFSNWSEVIFGFTNLLDWYRTTKGGYALHSVLRTPSEKRRDHVILEEYLENLSPKRPLEGESMLNPILIKAGAIAQGEVETVSFYLTNYNPVPVNVAIDVGEVEGMSVTIGRDLTSIKGGSDSLVEHLPGILSEALESKLKATSGIFRGHSLEGIRQFIISDQSARDFFKSIPFRDDISMSYTAVAEFPALKSLFWSYAESTFHRDLLPQRFTDYGLNKCSSPVHPPFYGAFKRKLPKKRFPGPVMLSHDRKILRSLDVCWDADGEPAEKKSDGSHTSLPPGGVIRFDVSIRSPPSTALDKDITQFVGTGLSLSTDHGQVIPIIASFEAIQGKLDMSYIPPINKIQWRSYSNDVQNGLIQVPVNLFSEPPGKQDISLKIPPHQIRSIEDLANVDAFVPQNASSASEGVSLFIKSSFKRDIYLRKILSCNPWFRVFAAEKSSGSKTDPFLGVFIGVVNNFATCASVDGVPRNETAFPSFYRCALSWLKWRSDFHTRGCGKMWKGPNGASSQRAGFNERISLLKRALLATEWSDELYFGAAFQETRFDAVLKSGRQFRGGLVSSILIEVISKALDALQMFSDSGLLSMVSNFRSVVEYNATPEEMSPFNNEAVSLEDTGRLLSVAIRNTTAESILETPRLLKRSAISEKSPFGPFDAPSVEFRPTLVGNVASIMLPLENPTAIPVRVRLGIAPTENRVEDTVRSRFLGGYPNPYIQKGVLSSSPKDYAHHQWWEKGGAFFQPDQDGDLIRSHFNVTVKSGATSHVSLVNPSFLATTAFLVGCGVRCGQRSEQRRTAAVQTLDAIISLSPTSPIGASAAAGQVLIGREKSFADHRDEAANPPITLAAGASLIADGSGPAAFGVPFAALGEVIIPPFGNVEIGPILFRPPGRSPILGCEATKGTKFFARQCESQEFQSLVFLENSLSGLERVVLRGKALWEKIVILDPNPDEIGNIELRNGIQTLVFSGSSQGTRRIPLAEVREILIQNDGDIPVDIAQGFLSRRHLNKEKQIEKVSYPCQVDNFRILECPQIFPFQLLPGQNRSIFIEHKAKCRKRRDYVVLVFHTVNTFDSDGEGISLLGIKNYSPGFRRQILADSPATLLRRSHIKLAVGFEMNVEEFKHCIPVATFENAAKSEDAVSGQKKAKRSACGHNWWKTLVLVSIVFVLVAWSSHLSRDFYLISSTNITFWGCSNAQQKHSSTSESQLPVGGKNWLAAFRCLARADPTAADLQNLGREQTRQILLARLQEAGAMPPQCFTSAGVAIRDRPLAGNQGSLNRQRVLVGNGAPPVSTERIRISEAIFGRFNARIAGGHGCLPSRLGWKTAVAKGLFDSECLSRSSMIQLRTEKLMRFRQENPSALEEPFIEESESFNGSRNETSSAFDSSYDELSDDDILEKHVIVPVQIPSTIEARDASNIDNEQVLPGSQSTRGKESERNISSSIDSLGGERHEVGRKRTWLSPHEQASDTTFPSTKPERNKLILQTGLETKADTKIPFVVTSSQRLPEQGQSKVADKRTADGNVLDDTSSESMPTTATALVPTTEVEKQNVFSSKSGGKKRLDRMKEKSKIQASDKIGKRTDERKEKKTLKARQPGSIKNDSTVDVKSTVENSSQRAQPGHPSKRDDKKVERSKRRKDSPTKKESGTAISILASGKKKVEQPDHKIEVQSPLDRSPTSPVKSPTTLRPPPGLAPPPGFESPASSPFRPKRILAANSKDDVALHGTTNISMDSADHHQDIAAHTTQSVSDVSASSRLNPLFLSDTPDVLSKNCSEDAGIGDNIPLLVDHTTYAQGDRMSDFDVMDFLDGILGESEGDEEVNRISSVQEYLPPVMLPANPWASEHSEQSKLSSRAAAYGIAVEDTSDRADDPLVISLPLLTPATILSSDISHEKKDDKKQKSFYASLLNEDG